MHKKIHAFLNFVLFVLMVWVNAMANILPINGHTTGWVSALYPNFFVPAGFTFSIWGAIYFLLLGFVVASIVVSFSNKYPDTEVLIKQVSPLFQITCLLNAGWILAWHYLFLEVSLIIMIIFLVILIKIYLRIRDLKCSVGMFSRLWVYHAFVVYLAWISVATIANVTALLVGVGWQGNPFLPQSWAIALVCIALALAIVFVGRLKEPAFGFVVAWAFIGIYANQIDAARNVGLTAAVSCCLLSALTLTILINTRKKIQ